MLAWAIRGDMRLRQPPYRQCVVHHLHERICIRVEDMRLETTERRSIVETTRLSANRMKSYNQAQLTRSQSPQHRTLSIQSRPCDNIWESRQGYTRVSVSQVPTTKLYG